MKISGIAQQYKPYIQNPVLRYKDKKNTFVKIAPIPFDSVSFGKLTKAKFSGFDLAAINRFKAPIEKFNSNQDLQKWCLDKIQTEYQSKNYPARSQETTTSRTRMIDEWRNFLLNSNNGYSNAEALIILNSITNGLNPTNENLPPVFDEDILRKTTKDIKNKLDRNRSYDFNFAQIYSEYLRNNIISENENISDKSGWIIIPSQDNNPEHYFENVKKLQTLSCKLWCTKRGSAEKYLAAGDFHIYLEKGQPKLGICTENNIIRQIQGELNNCIIPIKYLEILKQHISEHMDGYKMTQFAYAEIDKSEKLKKEADKLIAKLGGSFEGHSTEEILNAAGIGADKDIDGKIVIDEYRPLIYGVDLSDLGLDSNSFLKDIKAIKGSANFRESEHINLESLEEIGGYADFSESKVTSLPSLRTIKGIANFYKSLIKE